MKLGCIVAATAAILFGSVYVFAGEPQVIQTTVIQVPPTTSEDSVVMVNLADGHGSGVHIGNGLVVTAAHVADGTKPIKIKSSDGAEADAEVLWANKAYDVALLSTKGKIPGSAEIDCRAPKLGDEIQAAGNPLNLEFVSSFGRIAGNVRKADPWREVVITDITTVMGVSGGPVFGKDGRVVGIAVGVVPAPLKIDDGKGGTTYAPSLTGFGTAVPGSVICMLLGRGAA
ncbi:S1 family peptidase [Rhizobium leguminosarum]|uniref:S1 family peptidase n=1 Tax=Rhizobium leguminosarum TaxID=384 RepID=UPI0013E294FD|nr:serine protease [Rhizobium leguminosarum]